MEKNLEDKIQKASWKIQDLLDDVRENLLHKVRRLPPRKRRELPKFSGLWRERNLKSYLERLQEAIEKPRITRSKKLLKSMGVSSGGLPKEILENVEQIEETNKLFDQLKKELGKNANVLTEKEILTDWLKESTTKANERLQSILDAKAGFKRLIKLGDVDEELMREILENAFEDFEFIGKADELKSRIVYISGFGINVEYHVGHLSDFLENCEIIYNALKEFEDIYKISTGEVSAWVEGKNIAEIRKYLEGNEDPFSAEYAKLKRRWRELASILGEESPEPEGFPDLEKKIKRLEAKFKESLGESGLRLLGFFRSEANFPHDLTKEDLITILKRLQPFIMIGLKEEDYG